jgi:tRNA-specific 2-thiouridylase
MDSAASLDCTRLATGHYAKTERSGSRYLLKCATDPDKDQSYMLWTLSQEQLSKVILPLGDIKKSDVRELAASLSFENAYKKDSQDVCFIPDGCYSEFIELYSGIKSKPGNYIDTDGNVLGRHKGIINYTIGQRRGLGISADRPLYVIELKKEKNEVVLGYEEDCYKQSLVAADVNWLSIPSPIQKMEVLIKLRSSQKPELATLTPNDDNTVSISFFEKQKAVALGQSAVFYDEKGFVLGGGFIDKV